MSLKLDIRSTNLWSEFVGYTDCMGRQLHQQVPYASGPRKIEKWAESECNMLDNKAVNVVKYHSFIVPNRKTLTFHTPLMNQSILMATASPPVVMDLSTTEELSYRFPPQWSTFPQFGDRITAKMKKLKHTHAFDVMFQT